MVFSCLISSTSKAISGICSRTFGASKPFPCGVQSDNALSALLDCGAQTAGSHWNATWNSPRFLRDEMQEMALKKNKKPIETHGFPWPANLGVFLDQQCDIPIFQSNLKVHGFIIHERSTRRNCDWTSVVGLSCSWLRKRQMIYRWIIAMLP